jgi:hypothetical protein
MMPRKDVTEEAMGLGKRILLLAVAGLLSAYAGVDEEDEALSARAQSLGECLVGSIHRPLTGSAS